MKTGDLVTLSDHCALFQNQKILKIVKRVDKKNNWLFVFGCETPYQMNLWRVVSESR